MNFHQIQFNFYLTSAALVFAVIAYKFKTFQKANQSQLLLGVLALIFRICNIVTYWALPYQDYHTYFAILAYATQSILIFTTFLKISSKSQIDQTTQQELIVKSATEPKHFIHENKDSIFLLAVWNLLLFFFMTPFQIVHLPLISRSGVLLLVASYWMTAHYFCRKVTEGAKIKFDIIITCLIMLGFIHLLSTLFDPYIMRYQTAIDGALYICEAIAVFNITDLTSFTPKEESNKFTEVQNV